IASGPLTIGQIARVASITQPAATQTVNLMIKDGLVSSEPGPTDARQRLIRLTPKAQSLLPRLEACCRATAGAAASLDAELPAPLSEVLAEAIAALERKPFGQRLADARADQSA